MLITEAKNCCIIGDEYLNDFDRTVIDKVAEYIENMILNGYDYFSFGGNGQFEQSCLFTLKLLSKTFTHIKYVYIEPIFDKHQKYPLKLFNLKSLIDDSDFCLFFIEQKNGEKYELLKYAKSTNKHLLNFGDLQ